MGAANRPPDQTGVVDAGLCHGSAGLAHLFNRMYQMTAEPILADAARLWVGRTLELCSAALARDATRTDDAARAAWNGPGLLEGAAGIGTRPGSRVHHGGTHLGPDAARLHHGEPWSVGEMSSRGQAQAHPVAAPSGFSSCCVRPCCRLPR